MEWWVSTCYLKPASVITQEVPDKMQVPDSTNLQKVSLNLAFKGAPFWNEHGALTTLTSGSLSSTWLLCPVKSVQSPRLSILLHSSWKYYCKIHSWEFGVFPWPIFPSGIGFSASLWVPQASPTTTDSHHCRIAIHSVCLETLQNELYFLRHLAFFSQAPRPISGTKQVLSEIQSTATWPRSGFLLWL